MRALIGKPRRSRAVLASADGQLRAPAVAHRVHARWVGEIPLTLWLIAVGVNGRRWREVKLLAKKRVGAM